VQNVKAGVRAFRKGSLVSQPHILNSDYDKKENRFLRYAILWNEYSGTLYDHDTINTFVKQYKTQFGLYHSIRNIYNPQYRSVEFWRAHIWRGAIDLDESESSAIPIGTENDTILDPLKLLYKWSNWNVNKSVVVLYGASMGDVGIKIVDDINRGQVYFEVIDPRVLTEVKFDSRGNVKAYTLEERRENPNDPDNTVDYKEEVTRGEGQEVIFKTFVNGHPFPWDGVQEDENGEIIQRFNSEGELLESHISVQQYGFIPLVVIHHNKIGGEWGMAELQPSLPTIRELDDQQSKLDDQIRKTVDATWLMTGQGNPPKETAFSNPRPSTDQELLENPNPARESQNMIYATNPDAKAFPMVAPLNLAGAILNIDRLLTQLESNHPELNRDLFITSADPSGVAIDKAREPVVDRVIERRVNYDNGLTQANMMALSIMGMRSLAPFNEDSFKSGALDHQIASDRPVFAISPTQIATLDKVQAEALKIEAETLKLPTVYLFRQQFKRDGLSDKQIEAEIKQLMEDGQQQDRFGLLPPKVDEAISPANVQIEAGPIAVDSGKDTPENVAADDGLNGAQLRAVIDSLLLINGDKDGNTLPSTVVKQLLILETVAPDVAEQMVQDTVREGRLAGVTDEQIERADPETEGSRERQQARVQDLSDIT